MGGNGSDAFLDSLQYWTKDDALVIDLLEHYEIPFPYEQVSGLTDVDLVLTIDLATVTISAVGRFQGGGDGHVHHAVSGSPGDRRRARRAIP